MVEFMIVMLVGTTLGTAGALLGVYWAYSDMKKRGR